MFNKVQGNQVMHDVYVCLSTDAKQTDGINNGSELIEMDTSKKYRFSKDGGEWLEMAGGSGGGGAAGGGVLYLSIRSAEDLVLREATLAADGTLSFGDGVTPLDIINALANGIMPALIMPEIGEDGVFTFVYQTGMVIHENEYLLYFGGDGISLDFKSTAADEPFEYQIIT